MYTDVDIMRAAHRGLNKHVVYTEEGLEIPIHQQGRYRHLDGLYVLLSCLIAVWIFRYS